MIICNIPFIGTKYCGTKRTHNKPIIGFDVTGNLHIKC